MNELIFMKDYKHNENLRKSFNELATMIFGIHFEDWYEQGFWSQRYIPFSYIDKGRVVANVSVNVLDFVMDGEKKSAIQLGTVMTHPDYRNKGLSARLMNKVLEEYEGKYDYMYLFANQTVLDFYPRFGFTPINETQYSMKLSLNQTDNTGVRRLNGNNFGDLQFIFDFATDRVPVSKRFGTDNSQGILMFHCMYVLHQDIYYVEHEDAIVIFKKADEQIDIFDVISKKEISIHAILSKVADQATKKVVFHFTPDYPGICTEAEVYHGSDVWFIKRKEQAPVPLNMKHPLTSQA